MTKERLPVFVAVATTIIVAPVLMDPINLPKLWVLSIGAALCLFVLAEKVYESWKEINKPLMLFTFATFSGVCASSIASDQGFYRTFFGTWGRNNGALAFVGLLVLFLTMALVGSSKSPRILVVTLVNLGVASTIYGFIQISGADPITWNTPGNAFLLTLGNSNFASAFLALTGVATLTLIFMPNSNVWKRIFFSGVFLCELYLTHKSGSIQGFLVLLIGSFTFIGFFLSTSLKQKYKSLGLLWWGLFLTAGTFGAIGLFGGGPLSEFLNPNLRSLEDRYYHWVAAANMMKENVVFGVGIDSFGDYYRLARVMEAIELRGTAISGTNNAHNSIMQIGATGGLVLLIPYLILLSYIAYRGFSALRTNNQKVLASGVFAIWIAFQIQSLVSIDQIGLVVWGWVAAGCLVGISYAGSESSTKKGVRLKESNLAGKKFSPIKYAFSFLLILGITPSVILVSDLRNEFQLRNQIIELISDSDAVTVSKNAIHVSRIARDSKQPELRLQTLPYLLKVGKITEALELAMDTTSEFPQAFDAWDSVARIYEGLGERQKAIFARKKTILLDPLNEDLKKLLLEDQSSN
jgi:O-antigen ligase